MKVILQQDIRGKGKRGQMIEVSDGYARNYMLPRKLAVEATPDNVNTMRMNDKAQQEKRQREREEAFAISARMKELTVTVRAKGGALIVDKVKELGVQAKYRATFDRNKGRVYNEK